MPGLSANPATPYYHLHCPFRLFGMLIAGGSFGPMATHLINDGGFHCLSHCLISSFFQRLKDIWQERTRSFDGIEFLHLSKVAFSSTCSSFSDEGECRTDGTSSPKKPRRNFSNGRHMTNMIIAINILVYTGQLATHGKLLHWGAKINSLIDKGQWWRLATSNFLHVNVTHLTLNCYCLHVIGPDVEAFSGPKRFLTIYGTSAIASSAMSYWLNKASCVGASGACFGLVGYMALYIMRHRSLSGDVNEDLKYISRIIILNMVVGLSLKSIDNWGHVGGFLGGVVASLLLDSFGKLEHRSRDGRKTIDNIEGRADPGQPK